MVINDLSPAERRVWEAFPRGASVDFGADPGTVRASVLRTLLLTAPREEGEVAALKIRGARITGALDLKYATVDSVIRLSDCHFEETPDFSGAQLSYLNLSKSVLPGVRSARVRVDGGVRLTDCRFRGPVRLTGAQISGTLFMERTEVTAPDGEPALRLNQAEIGEELCAPGLRARGEVRLAGAKVAGSLNLNQAHFERPGGGIALSAETLTAEADVEIRRAHVQGRLEMRGARIAGRLDLSYTRMANPGGTALRASSCVIGELWLRNSPRMEGVLNLRRSQIEVLFVEPDVVPDQVHLNNLTYTSLLSHLPAPDRLPMLARDTDGFIPHSYEQLTAAYRRIGDDDAARLVQLAKQRRRRATLPWFGRLWGYAQDATVGYGFRPLRAAVWLLSLLAIGSVAYELDHPAPLKAGEAPKFNAVFYTLDLLLPIIDFGQERTYAPEGWAQWLSYVLVITGWILATTVVTGVTRTVSRQ